VKKNDKNSKKFVLKFFLQFNKKKKKTQISPIGKIYKIEINLMKGIHLNFSISRTFLINSASAVFID